MMESNFKNALFASNPELYFAVFPEDKKPAPGMPTEDVEDIVPESEYELQEMLTDFGRFIGEGD